MVSSAGKKMARDPTNHWVRSHPCQYGLSSHVPTNIRSQHWRKEETGQEYSLLFLSYTKSGCFLHSRVMDSLPLILGFIVTLSSTERVANMCLSCWCLRKGWSLEEKSLVTTEAEKHAESCVKVIFHIFPIIPVATKMWNNIGHVE